VKLKAKAKCPKCGGPVEVVRRWSDGAVAYRCVRGHRRRSKNGEVNTVHPVYIIRKG
jgi:Zn ribbon nucleic-acid-binding protein